MYMNERNERKVLNRQFQEASTLRKACNDTQYFWDMVNRNFGTTLRKPVNKAQEERLLFGKMQETEGSEQGIIDDSIAVERSGPRAEEIPVLSNFSELEGKVPAYIMRNIQLMRYEIPTPIQKHAVPLGLAGADLMCCAQTGSGKTFSFLLPVVTAMQRICFPSQDIAQLLQEPSADTPSEQSDSGAGTPSGLKPERVSVNELGAQPVGIVLAPTRELASQIHLDARRIIYGSSLKAVCVYGGNDLRQQLLELSTGCDLIVATPGRLWDLVERGCVSLCQIALLVLDEADRMLDMGFEPQIRKIIQQSDMPVTGQRQTFMFSATFPDEIQLLAREFLYNYVWVSVGRVGSTVENITQQVLCASADPNSKVPLLLGALQQTNGRTLVFVQKRRTASWLCEILRGHYGVRAEEIHGDRSQSQREYALKQFREGTVPVLVATDVAARGLDIPAVTHVIQFDLPISSEDFDVYVHRIGRTGRAGLSGLATALYVPGRETGEGNGKIAHQILRLLQENSQSIPEWFLNCDDIRYGSLTPKPAYGGAGRGGYQGRGGGSGSYGQQPTGGRFGFRDTRSDQQRSFYPGAPEGADSYGASPYQATASQYGGGYGQQSASGYEMGQQDPYGQSVHPPQGRYNSHQQGQSYGQQRSPYPHQSQQHGGQPMHQQRSPYVSKSGVYNASPSGSSQGYGSQRSGGSSYGQQNMYNESFSAPPSRQHSSHNYTPVSSQTSGDDLAAQFQDLSLPSNTGHGRAPQLNSRDDMPAISEGTTTGVLDGSADPSSVQIYGFASNLMDNQEDFFGSSSSGSSDPSGAGFAPDVRVPGVASQDRHYSPHAQQLPPQGRGGQYGASSHQQTQYGQQQTYGGGNYQSNKPYQQPKSQQSPHQQIYQQQQQQQQQQHLSSRYGNQPPAAPQAGYAAAPYQQNMAPHQHGYNKPHQQQGRYNNNNNNNKNSNQYQSSAHVGYQQPSPQAYQQPSHTGNFAMAPSAPMSVPVAGYGVQDRDGSNAYYGGTIGGGYGGNGGTEHHYPPAAPIVGRYDQYGAPPSAAYPPQPPAASLRSGGSSLQAQSPAFVPASLQTSSFPSNTDAPGDAPVDGNNT